MLEKQTFLENSNIDETLCIVKNIADALKEIKQNNSSLASVCKSHELNWQKVRKLLLGVNECKLVNTAPISELEIEVFDNYENFYNIIFGESDFVKVRALLPYDYVETIEYVLNNADFTERQVYVLRQRFGLTEEGISVTLKDIAETLNVSSSAVGDCERRAILKLRYSTYARVLLKGLSRHMVERGESQKEHYDKLAQYEIECLENKEKELRKQMNELMKQLVNIKNGVSDTISYTNNLDIVLLNEKIDVLEGLSIRSYNCVKRAGIKTVNDLLNLTNESLCNIRNLGSASTQEIRRELNTYLQKTCNMNLEEYYRLVYPEKFKDYLP